jgi:hypothetical protein
MSNGSAGPHGGVKVEYENVVFKATDGKIDVTVTTETAVVGTQIDQKTGKVIGGSNVPKAPPKD